MKFQSLLPGAGMNLSLSSTSSMVGEYHDWGMVVPVADAVEWAHFAAKIKQGVK